MAYNKNTNRGYHDKGNKFKALQMLQWAISKAIKDFKYHSCPLYTYDAADEQDSLDMCCPGPIKKKTQPQPQTTL